MQAAQDDIIIEEGAVFDETYTWRDSTGDAVDLSGYTAAGEGKKNKGGAVLFTFTITLGGANGTIQLELTSSQTRTLSFDTAYYDVEVSPSGAADLNTAADVIRVLEGRVTFSREVTE